MLMAAVTLAIAWRWTLATLNAAGAATFAWASLALTAPYLLNSFTVYPEIAAGLAVMVAMVLTLRDRPSLGPWIAAGAGDRVAAVAEHEIRANVRRPLAHRHLPSPSKGTCCPFRNAKVWALVGVYALSLAAWFAFFYAHWGTPLPMAPYGSMTQTSPLNLRVGAPGLVCSIRNTDCWRSHPSTSSPPRGWWPCGAPAAN